MCVAAIINKSVSLSYLKHMDQDNPHGGGVAWFDGDAICFERNLNAETIFAMQDEGIIKLPYLLHFRWATHGGVKPELTHPFPTGIRAFAGELTGRAHQVIIHNGVWNRCYDWVEWLPDSVSNEVIAATSDTAIAAFFYEQLPDIGDEIPWAVASATVTDGAEGRSTMKIRKHGGWTAWQGNEFSNLNWLPWRDYYEHSPTYGTGNRYYSSKRSKPYVRSWEKGWHWDGDDDSWSDYVRSRYGHDMADEGEGEVTQTLTEALADTPDDADLMAKLADEDARLTTLSELDADFPLEEIMGDDLVSEQHEDVNKFLAQEFLKRKTTDAWQGYVQCERCEVYTRSTTGICSFCKKEETKAA